VGDACQNEGLGLGTDEDCSTVPSWPVLRRPVLVRLPSSGTGPQNTIDDTTRQGVHPTQIMYFGATFDEGIEVESVACKSRIPETRDSTPGSTRQLSACQKRKRTFSSVPRNEKKGNQLQATPEKRLAQRYCYTAVSTLGGCVLYVTFVMASSAGQERGPSSESAGAAAQLRATSCNKGRMSNRQLCGG